MSRNLVPLLFLLVTNIVFVTGAQIFLKMGSSRLAEGEFAGKGLIKLVSAVALNPHIILGTLCYAVSLAVWIYILTKARISVAYPFMSLSYVTVMLLSIVFFKEIVSNWQWLGAGLIISGTSLIFLK